MTGCRNRHPSPGTTRRFAANQSGSSYDVEFGPLSALSHRILTNIELMGDQLNKCFPATLTVAVLALTGCSGGDSDAAAEPAPETTKAVFSAEQTCNQLFDKGDEGRMFGAVAFLQNLPDPVTEKDQTKARTFVTELEFVAGTANDEMKPLIIDMAKTLDGFASAKGDRVHVNVDSFKSAGSKLIDLCPTQAEAYGDEKSKKEAAVKADADADAAAKAKAAAGAEPKSAPTLSAMATANEDRFVKEVRAAHPAMKSTDTKNMVDVAKNFCLIYDKGVENGQKVLAASTVQRMIAAAAGIEYTRAELQSIHDIGVRAFCPQHIG